MPPESLQDLKDQITKAVAEMSDAELKQFFPVSTLDDKLYRLGYLSGHKYLSPPLFREREELISHLYEENVIEPLFENPFPCRVASLFEFAGEDAQKNHEVFMKGFSDKLNEPH